jgi:hypothetical protein
LIDDIEKRKHGIKDAEWVVTVQLEANGEPIGDTFILRYADSVLAKAPLTIGWLIAKRLQEEALPRTAAKRRGKTR